MYDHLFRYDARFLYFSFYFVGFNFRHPPNLSSLRAIIVCADVPMLRCCDIAMCLRDGVSSGWTPCPMVITQSSKASTILSASVRERDEENDERCVSLVSARRDRKQTALFATANAQYNTMRCNTMRCDAMRCSCGRTRKLRSERRASKAEMMFWREEFMNQTTSAFSERKNTILEYGTTS